jgi:hypothetical protein
VRLRQIRRNLAVGLFFDHDLNRLPGRGAGAENNPPAAGRGKVCTVRELLPHPLVTV